MKKVKAFTLVELLVSMLISSIVISMAYVSYDIVYKQFSNYKNINKKINEVILIDMLLKNDFFQAKEIYCKTSDKLIFKDKQNHENTYLFTPGYIIRKSNEVNDTLFIGASKILFKFQNEELFSDNASLTNKLMDEFCFESFVLGEIEQFHYKKEYAADVLMNWENGKTELDKY